MLGRIPVASNAPNPRFDASKIDPICVGRDVGTMATKAIYDLRCRTRVSEDKDACCVVDRFGSYGICKMIAGITADTVFNP